MKRKGIILAGGNGSRLYPLTKAINKQLLPVFDKPMIYYPISTLMLIGIRDILLISRPQDLEIYKKLLSNGQQWGLDITYSIQESPNGLAESFIIGKDFLQNDPSVLILGDNIFYGDGLVRQLEDINDSSIGSYILGYLVKEAERYGVIEFTKKGKVIAIEEKPKYPKSNYAVTGLYFYDNTVTDRVRSLRPSKRGELEITDLNNLYLKDNLLNVKLLSRGMAWFDTGTHESLHEASSFIRSVENRQGMKIGCPEEIAWRHGWISSSHLEELAIPFLNSSYGNYLKKLLEDNNYPQNSK